MDIRCITVGELEVNCYLLTEGAQAIVIDPGAEPERILSEIKKTGAELKKIVLTHGHFDHFGAAAQIKRETGAEICIHQKDEIMLSDDEKNLCHLTWNAPEHCEADCLLEDGDIIELGNTKIKVYHTPGHSEGGITLDCGDCIFCGDLLFRGSIGRFDHGNLRTELKSLKLLMDTFKDNVCVFSGHGESTTIGEERRSNPYIINHVLD